MSLIVIVFSDIYMCYIFNKDFWTIFSLDLILLLYPFFPYHDQFTSYVPKKNRFPCKI